MAKPILAVFIQGANAEELDQFRAMSDKSLISREYYMIGFSTDGPSDIKVFFEKDQVELDKAKLEELLALSKPTGI